MHVLQSIYMYYAFLWFLLYYAGLATEFRIHRPKNTYPLNIMTTEKLLLISRSGPIENVWCQLKTCVDILCETFFLWIGNRKRVYITRLFPPHRTLDSIYMAMSSAVCFTSCAHSDEPLTMLYGGRLHTSSSHSHVSFNIYNKQNHRLP